MSRYILEIRDEDLGLEPVHVEAYRFREAARTVVFNSEGEIALLNIGKHNYHKLPGGGIEDGEDWVKAVHREALEEVGATIKLRDNFLAKILEVKSRFGIKQTSYCCISDLVGEIVGISPEDDEIEDKQFPVWVTLDRAIELIKNDDPDDYQGRFIGKRDLAFLEAVKKEVD